MSATCNEAVLAKGEFGNGGGSGQSQSARGCVVIITTTGGDSSLRALCK